MAILYILPKEVVFTNIRTKLREHSGIPKERRIALTQERVVRRY